MALTHKFGSPVSGGISDDGAWTGHICSRCGICVTRTKTRRPKILRWARTFGGLWAAANKSVPECKSRKQ